MNNSKPITRTRTLKISEILSSMTDDEIASVIAELELLDPDGIAVVSSTDGSLVEIVNDRFGYVTSLSASSAISELCD